MPNSVNAPLLSSKNQAVINFTGGMNGWDLQGAYSFTNHLGVMLNASGAPILNPKGKSYHGHKYAEGGLGGLFTFKENGVFDFYAGVGYGDIKTKSNFTLDGEGKTDKVEGNGYRYFVQPSIGFKKSKFEFAFSLRGVFLDLDNIRYNNSTILYQKEGMFIEPVFTFRVGGPKIKFQAQIGGSLPMQSSSLGIKYRPLLMSVGISWRLGE